mgnify:FL=1
MPKQILYMENPYYKLSCSITDNFVVMQSFTQLARKISAPNEQIFVTCLDFKQPYFFFLEKIHKLKQQFPGLKVVTFNAHFQKKDLLESVNYGVDYPVVSELGANFLLDFIRSLASQTNHFDYNKIQLGNLELNVHERTCRRGPHHILLRRKEFDLLHFLIQRKGKVVSRSEILKEVWQYHSYAQTNTVDVHFSKLRKKLDRGFTKKLLHTVWGLGYKLDLVP